MVTFTDVTARKRAEEALRLSTQQFSRAFDSAAIGMALVALDGHWLKVSQTVCEITGYSEEELHGKTFQDITHPEDLERDLAYVRQMLAGEIRWYQMEKRYFHKHGHAVWILLSVSLVRDAQGQPLQFIAQIQDITERKRIEAQAREGAKMEAVGRLAAGVAHDFNNLLMIIKGYSDLLVRQLAHDHILRGHVQKIIDSTERAGSLPRQLLAFSRQQALQPMILDVNAVIVQLEGLLKQLVGDSIPVHLRLAPIPGWVRADKNQLDQVLINLAANAHVAMPHGGQLAIETVVIRPESKSASAASQKDEPIVRLTVSNTEMGMDAETARRVVEPIFTTKEIGESAGLGLAIAYEIIAQIGGTIAANSVWGQGTTVIIDLPLSLPPPQPSVPARQVAAVAHGSTTILLVDDEPLVRELVQDALQSEGYRVLACASGKEAIQVLSNTQAPIHLLLTDVVMPGMNGRELAAKAIAQDPLLQVLFMSGYTDDRVLQDGVSGAQLAFLQKPFSMQVLLEKVYQVLAQGGPSC
ncbi:MAG: PAS domain S-box protein [Nitrospirota bacterium]|nr:PAS domain S-box protein [Nitrospirota bacterium]